MNGLKILYYIHTKRKTENIHVMGDLQIFEAEFRLCSTVKAVLEVEHMRTPSHVYYKLR